jgi:hypothetical protein
LLTDEYGGGSVLYWTSQHCPCQVLERLLDKTKLDVNTRIGVSVHMKPRYNMHG